MDTKNQESTSEVTASPLRHKFVARQPIFDKNIKLQAYELLFRSGFDNTFDEFSNQEHASSRTLMDSFFLFGIKELANNKRVFINFTGKV
ncbi:MAG: hypothetical protein GY950_11205, partial [bacterium]|nr:hypothetical protein [bacterium]